MNNEPAMMEPITVKGAWLCMLILTAANLYAGYFVGYIITERIAIKENSVHYVVIGNGPQMEFRWGPKP